MLAAAAGACGGTLMALPAKTGAQVGAAAGVVVSTMTLEAGEGAGAVSGGGVWASRSAMAGVISVG